MEYNEGFGANQLIHGISDHRLYNRQLGEVHQLQPQETKHMKFLRINQQTPHSPSNT